MTNEKMGSKKEKGAFPKDLFKGLFKDLGFYFLILVIGILTYASFKVYQVYGNLFGRGEFWIVLIITGILLVILLALVYFYHPTNNLFIIPIAAMIFGIVFDFPILFKVSLIAAIIYPIWILVVNYVKFRKSQKEIESKYKNESKKRKK